MAKTEAQREAARQRRLARKARAEGEFKKERREEKEAKAQPKKDYPPGYFDRRGVSKDAANFDPTDYSAKGGYKRTQRWVMALIEELELLVEGPVPEDVTFGMVGNIAAIRVHLEKAIAHAKDTNACLSCPTNSMPNIRNHWKHR